jgi:protein SCO1/2
MTGTADQIRMVARTYKVYYAKVAPEGGTTAGDDYLMDHSSQIYLMGPDAAYITHFPSSVNAQRIADTLAQEVE